MKLNIALLPGDGIGTEIISVAVRVLEAIAKKHNHNFTFTTADIGAVAIDNHGEPYPKSTDELCKFSDAVLFGAIGDPKYDNNPAAKVRPEQGLLAMRKSLGLYANVRPIYTFNQLLDASPLKREIIQGSDFVVIRELTGGIYFGEPRGRSDNNTRAFDTCVYTKPEIERIVRYAFKTAQSRKKQLTVVDKANVLETSRLWRETVQELIPQFTDVAVEFMFVDNAAMQLIQRPTKFDVIVTENMFGDILTDEASVITGSIGMLPSASIGENTSVFEPIHGSYPQATGKNIANPIGTILSAAMMLEYSFGLSEEAKQIQDAVVKVLDEGFGTPDLNAPKTLGTKELGEQVEKSVLT